MIESDSASARRSRSVSLICRHSPIQMRRAWVVVSSSVIGRSIRRPTPRHGGIRHPRRMDTLSGVPAF
jgi:hypothetical protein